MVAISRWLRPSPYFTRRTSRILRMDNLLWNTAYPPRSRISREVEELPLHQVIQHLATRSTPARSRPGLAANHGASAWLTSGIGGQFASL